MFCNELRTHDPIFCISLILFGIRFPVFKTHEATDVVSFDGMFLNKGVNSEIDLFTKLE